MEIGEHQILMEYQDINVIQITIDNTNKTVDKYVIGKTSPDIILNHLQKFTSLLPGTDILDIGSGPGRDCKYFSDNGFNSIGIDLSEEMLKYARNNDNKSIYLNMDIRDLSKIPWKFDGIWSCASLHHLPKKYILNVLEQIHSILNDNGILFISVKQGNGESIELHKQTGVDKFYAKYHKDELINLLKLSKFEIIDTGVENKLYSWVNVYARKI